MQRSLLARLITALAVIGFAFCTAPAHALPAPDAVDRVGSCVAAAKSAQVLLLIDTSGSLKETDPQGARVTAATYLVDQLADFATESGAAIDVAVAGFSESYRPEIDWTRLDKASLGDITAGLKKFADYDDGPDTDYWAALNGAQSALGKHRPAEAGAQSCQVLAWFTDGKIDFSQHPGTQKPYAPGQDLGSQEGVAATVAAAKESICRAGGLADQLRSSGIVTFGIGLAPDGQNSADFDVLKSIVTGEPTAAGECGAIRTPTPGAFYLASNIDELLFAFDAFSTPGQPPQRTEAGVCPGTAVCENAKHRFTLDRSVRSVSVLASADSSGLMPVLVPPTGPPQELKPGAAATLDIGGVTVNYRWLSDKSVTFHMTNPEAPAWQGQWALVFEDPTSASAARTKTSIHISGDLFPAWPDQKSTTLHQDEVVPVTFGVVDSAQKPVDPATLMGQAELTVALIDGKGAIHPVAEALPKDRMTQPQQLDLHGVAPGKATLRMTLAVTTAATTDQSGAPVAGTALSPQSVDLPISISPPIGYPTIGPTVDFGLLDGGGTVQRNLPVTGPGCVWLPAAPPATIAAAPDGVGEITVTSTANGKAGCVKAAAGGSAELPLTITVPREGNGVVNGTMTVAAAPAEGDGTPVMVDVPFTLTVEKHLNTTKVLTVVILALLLGPGIPLLLLYVVKWWVSRIPGKALRTEQIPVQVRNGAVLRNGQPFAVADRDLTSLVQDLEGPTRRINIGEIDLAAKVGWSPFGAGFVVARAPGLVGAAGKAGTSHGTPPSAKLPLAVQNTWFVLHDPAGREDAATVVLLVGGDAGRPVIDRLSAEITDALPRVLPVLRRRAAQSAPPPGDGEPAPTPEQHNPFGSGSPTPTPTAGGDPFGGNPFGGASGRTNGGNPFGGSPGPAPGGDPFGRGGSSQPPSGGFSTGPGSGSAGGEPPNPFRPR